MTEQPISPRTRLWQRPLPLQRQDSNRNDFIDKVRERERERAMIFVGTGRVAEVSFNFRDIERKPSSAHGSYRRSK